MLDPHHANTSAQKDNNIYKRVTDLVEKIRTARMDLNNINDG